METTEVLNSPARALEYAEMKRLISPSKSVIFLEGRKDYEHFQSVVSDRNANFIELNGKKNVVNTAKLAKNGDGIIGVVDADTDYLLDVSYEDSIVTTDFYDLESFSINSDAINSVFRELLKLSSLTRVGCSNFLEYRDLCIKITSKIGAARAINARDSLGISFKNTRFSAMLKRGKYSVDVEDVVKRIFVTRKNQELGLAADRIADFQKDVSDLLDKLSDIKLASHSVDFCVVAHQIAKNENLYEERPDGDFSLILRKWIRSHLGKENLAGTKMIQEINKQSKLAKIGALSFR